MSQAWPEFHCVCASSVSNGWQQNASRGKPHLPVLLKVVLTSFQPSEAYMRASQENDRGLLWVALAVRSCPKSGATAPDGTMMFMLIMCAQGHTT